MPELLGWCELHSLQYLGVHLGGSRSVLEIFSADASMASVEADGSVSVLAICQLAEMTVSSACTVHVVFSVAPGKVY